MIINSDIIKLVKRAARFGADVIRRGRLTIGWAFNAKVLRFYVVVFIGGICRQTIKLKPGEFGRMFQGAAHWIGGET